MEGKTIKSSVELPDGLMFIRFDDNTVALVKVLDLEVDMAELNAFFIGEAEPEASKPKKEKGEDIQPNLDFENEKKKEEEPEPEGYTWDDLVALDRAALKTLIVENELETKPKDFDGDEDKLRKAIAMECEIPFPEDDSKEETTSDDDYTWEDLKEMDEDELDDLITEQDLDTDIDDFDENEDGLRRAVAKELGITPPEKKKKKKKKKK